MRSIRIAFALAWVLLACKTTPETKPTQENPVCSLMPEICERNCAGCDDIPMCFRAGGECLMRGGANIWFGDIADNGDDVFTPGCHYSYTDKECSKNATFINGDLCDDHKQQWIYEYTVTLPCHAGCSASRNCDDECKKLQLGGGRCVVLKNFCGAGQDSARCKCDLQPKPPPPPPEDPT